MFYHIYRIKGFLFSLFIMMMIPLSYGQQIKEELEDTQISVLTCGPGTDLYTLFGHSALRVYDKTTGSDQVYNWGTFDFGDPGFVNSIKFGLRFLSGKLPYKLSVSATSRFLRDYQNDQRFVDEQILDLTTTQKRDILAAVQTNLLPENIYYRYDFYYDNCTTRIRDLIEATIPALDYPVVSDTLKTFRDLLHENLIDYPWTQFGMDLLLGSSSDINATQREQMFLPLYYEQYLDQTQSNTDQLVNLNQPILEFREKHQSVGFFTPVWMFLILLVIEMIAFFIIYVSGNEGIFKWLDPIWFFGISLAGIVLLIMWFFTDHEVCANNWNLLWAWPLAFVPFLVKKEGRRFWFFLTIFFPFVALLGYTMVPQSLPAPAISISLITILKSLRQLHIATWLDGLYFNKASLAGIFLFCCFGIHGQEKIGGITLVSPPSPYVDNPMIAVSDVHANWVAVVPYGFSRSGTPEVYHGSNQWWGETEEGIRTTIALAREQGLKIMVKPQVWIPRGWVGEMDFEDEKDWKIWEESYRDYILLYARLAESMGVSLFCVGTEYRICVKKREKYWRDLIGEIRSIYSGKLTYSANWDSYMNVPIWDVLDIIGISAYFPLTEETTPSVDFLKIKWRKPVKALKEFSQRKQKPILFTEYGYLSVDGTAGRTWELENKIKSLKINEKAQANALEALYRAFWDEEFWLGGFLWKWFPEGQGHEGYPERDYTPQDKLAYSVLSDWYQRTKN